MALPCKGPLSIWPGVRRGSASHHLLRRPVHLSLQKHHAPKLQPEAQCSTPRCIRTRAAESGASGDGAAVLSPASAGLSTKDKVVALSCAALCVSNMDKVNISIAIIPMAQEFGWGAGETGIIQSSFFAGYLLMNLPGGYLASRLGGRRTLPVGLGTWSLATALAPLATTVSGLGLSRAMVGLGQAVAPTSIVDMIARIVRKEERASAVSLAFAGLHVGSIVGLLAAPILIGAAGWRALFVTFGAAGLIWYAAFEAMMQDIYKNDPEIASKLSPSTSEPAKGGETKQEQVQNTIPYRAFLRSQPVQALCFTHFANNWMHYTMLAWLPSYFTEVLHLENLGDAAHTSVFPPLAGIVCSVLAGPIADKLIMSGAPLPIVRKVTQTVAMLGPAACLVAASIDTNGTGEMVVPLITLALGLSSFSLAGLYCTHQDMSPKYAGAMLGLTNTTGAIAGILSVSAVGVLKELTHSWDAALIVPNVIVLTAGSLCYTLLCRNGLVDFDAADNSPFAVEKYLDGPKRAVGTVGAALSTAFAAVEKLTPQPPKELVQAARKERLTRERNAAMASAAASMGSLEGARAAPSFASASLASGQATASKSSRSIASLVTSSLSGFRESEGVGGASNAMLVSQWTTATMIPDYGQPVDSWEDTELLDAEEEVARIMQQMKVGAEAAAAPGKEEVQK